ncbi:MAG: Crp/Fnr family transcriptional regulator [Lutibacter sp.]|nr:Crp/Fnr family transcriptional regulator [Lutibacter sp.]
MHNLNDQDLNNIHYKHRKSLNYNLKLIANYKATSHLIELKKIKKGHFLVEERKNVHGIYFILKGKVKVFNEGFDDKIKILRLVSKGEIVGLSSLNASHYWSSAIVVEDVDVYFIGLKNLKIILKTNIKLSFLFVNALALKLQHYEMRQKYLSLFQSAERIIDALLLIAYKFGEKTSEGLEISVCTSRKDIAAFSNTTKENVIRTLSKLKDNELILIEGKKITIKNKEALIGKLKEYIKLKNSKIDFDFFYPNLFY